MKALVDGGRLGRPILATAQVKWYRTPEYYRDSRWRGTQALDGGGALMNQGVHTVDLLLWLFGPCAVCSDAPRRRCTRLRSEDTAVAVLEFANGALGTIEAATSAYPGYSRRIELTGSEGTIVLDGDRLAAVDLTGTDWAGRAGRGAGGSARRGRDRKRLVADRGRRVRASAGARGFHPRDPHAHRAELRRPRRAAKRGAGRSHLCIVAKERIR